MSMLWWCFLIHAIQLPVFTCSRKLSQREAESRVYKVISNATEHDKKEENVGENTRTEIFPHRHISLRPHWWKCNFEWTILLRTHTDTSAVAHADDTGSNACWHTTNLIGNSPKNVCFCFFFPSVVVMFWLICAHNYTSLDQEHIPVFDVRYITNLYVQMWRLLRRPCSQTGYRHYLENTVFYFLYCVINLSQTRLVFVKLV